MKEINNVFLATNKDGSAEEILKKLPPRGAGYSAIFGDIPAKDIEKTLKMLSETDEDLHPAMFIPMGFFYDMTPNAIMDFFINKNANEQQYFDRFIRESVEQVTGWLFNNRKIINKLITYCKDIYIDDLSEDRFELENYKMTPEIEKIFIEDAFDNKDRQKRIKLLAALDVLHRHQDMRTFLEKNETFLAALFMFLFTRSLAQFAVQRTVMDGRGVQKGRRNKRPVQKTGFEALKKHFKETYPAASAAMLWRLIKRDLKGKPFTYGGYTVEYRPEVTDSRETSGQLVQTKEDGKERALQYEAFRKIKF